MNRRTQMYYLLGLTAISLIPIYGLLGFQTGPHSAKDVWPVVWIAESIAWSFRALIEAWALIYLFSTHTPDSKTKKTLVILETALISLIAISVTLLIIANKGNQSVSELPSFLFWLWSFSVALFAPLMFAGVGIAYRVHEAPLDSVTVDTLLSRVSELESKMTPPEVSRHDKVKQLKSEGFTLSQIADNLSISVATVNRELKNGYHK